jgi:hypothetical protein
MALRIFRLSRKTKKYLWRSAFAFFLTLNFVSFGIAYFATHFSGAGNFGATKPPNLRTPSAIDLDYTTAKIAINLVRPGRRYGSKRNDNYVSR